jgi:glycosyltransferase involved in cell wall biosynthesis
MAFFRHFVERDDFEIFVVTDNSQILDYNVKYKHLLFKNSHYFERLSKTRFSKFFHSAKHLFFGYFIPKEISLACKEFNPDVVMTVAGTWSQAALMALQISKRLNKPLVGSFNDWFDYNLISHPSLKSLIERKFRSFYRRCHLALCTCEGMQEALGSHPNCHILYPIGTPRADSAPTFLPYQYPERKFIVGFGGSLGEWYGLMIERLVKACESRRDNIEFRIYGGNPSWSSEFDRHARETGIYRGQVPFAELQDAMSRVDALILPMGFGNECAHVEKTSFKTKFLDYLSYQKPIIVWGPDYCSAVRVATEFDSADVITDPEESAVLDSICKLLSNPKRQEILVENATKMYQSRFDPIKIHNGFMDEISNLIAKKQSSSL